VVDSSDEHLKFLKMHLNRYFSKISVFSSGSEAYKALKESPFDVVIVEGAPVKKSISDFLKKLSDRFRHIPVVMTKASESPPFTSGDYPGILVVDIIFKSFAMDPLHVAIRRAMNTRDLLRELAALLAPDAAIGKVVRTAQLLDLSDRRQSLVEEIRKRLTEEIAD
jgi:DNA-binding NtrC family response regulator